MGPTPYKPDAIASEGQTQRPFVEQGVPKTQIGFVSSLVRLARLRGFGFGAKPPGATPVSTVKSPVNMGSHGRTY